MAKSIVDTTIEANFDIFDKVQKSIYKNDEKLEKKHDKLVNIILDIFISEDTKLLKEKKSILS